MLIKINNFNYNLKKYWNKIMTTLHQRLNELEEALTVADKAIKTDKNSTTMATNINIYDYLNITNIVIPVVIFSLLYYFKPNGSVISVLDSDKKIQYSKVLLYTLLTSIISYTIMYFLKNKGRYVP